MNKEPLPFDPQPHDVTSGIRIGTPALTTRGFKAEQFQQIACWMSDALHNAHDPAKLQQIEKQVTAMAKQYPLFAEEWIPTEGRVTRI